MWGGASPCQEAREARGNWAPSVVVSAACGQGPPTRPFPRGFSPPAHTAPYSRGRAMLGPHHFGEGQEPGPRAASASPQCGQRDPSSALPWLGVW